MKTLYILVGVPGSGKSTWISQQEWPEDTAFISTDKFVESFAASIGKTYSEVFDEYMSVAVNLMAEEVLEAKRAGRTIVWDQTSTTVKARKKKILMLPEYHKIAVILPTPEATELNRRLKSRPGKSIPDFVMKQMLNIQYPTKEEGFDEIQIVK